MYFNEYVFKYEYEERKKQLAAINRSGERYERMTPIKRRKKTKKNRLQFNLFSRKKFE